MSTYERLGRHAQITLLIGDHLGDLQALVDHYLPKLRIDRTTFRMAELLKARWGTEPRPASEGEAPPANDGGFGLVDLPYGRIVIKPPEKLHGLVPESFETYQIVNPGDIVLRTTDLQNDHTSLRVGMVRDRGIITSAYLALRVNAGVSSDFGFQFLNVWDISKAIYGYGSGLRQNLDFSHFKRMPVAVPPPDEQAAIVRFLDWANGRLERAIRAKRKVIALLNEQKQAIIHRAVTRGLDPSVPLKPSGIPWLGDIPQHWEVRRVEVPSRIEKCDRALGDGTEAHCSRVSHVTGVDRTRTSQERHDVQGMRRTQAISYVDRATSCSIRCAHGCRSARQSQRTRASISAHTLS